MNKTMKKLFTALICAAFAALLAFGVVGCSKTIPQWITEQQCGEHEWNDGEITKEPTCTEEGEKVFTCTSCGKTEAQVLAMLPHTEEVYKEVPSTCQREGMTDAIKCTVCETWIKPRQIIPKAEHKIVIEKAVEVECLKAGLTQGSFCSVCNERFETQEIIPAPGHTLVTTERIAPTCTEDGRSAGQECTTCGKVFLEQTTLPATGHTVVKLQGYAKTCLSNGLTDGEKCTVCGEILVEQTAIVSSGHTPQEVKGRAATCTEDGLTNGSKCSTCGETLTAQAVIPALGHSAKTVVGKSATCTEGGLTNGKECATCGITLEAQTVIVAKGHTVYTVKGYAATCTEDGLTNGSKCSSCGETLTAQAVIPALGHTYENRNCIVCGETEAGIVLRDTSDYASISDYTGRELRMTWNIGAEDMTSDDLMLSFGDEEQGYEIGVMASLMGDYEDNFVIGGAQSPSVDVGHNDDSCTDNCSFSGFKNATVEGITFKVTRDDTHIYLDVIFEDVVSITFTIQDGSKETVTYDVLKCTYLCAERNAVLY